MKNKAFTRQNFLEKNLGGFTLIELLVVIAIIGLLASVVIVNSQKTRHEAHDARIQSLTHQLRNAAEMIYDRDEDYDEICDEGNNTVSDAGELGTIEAAIRKENGNNDVVCYESASKKDFAVSSPLRAETGKYWCTESAGSSLELNCQITSAQCQCP